MLNPFTALTSKIFGGLAIALLVAVGILAWQLSSTRSELTDTQNALAVEKANHAVTRASVANLERAIKAKNDESTARAKAYQDAANKARQDALDADKRYRATKSVNDALRANMGGDQCKTPEDVTDALSGF